MFEHLLATINIGALSFISTNIDDLFLLILLFSYMKNNTLSQFGIVSGQFFGMALLISVSLLSSYFGMILLSPDQPRFLGIFPIGLGLYKLFRQDTSLSIQELKKYQRRSTGCTSQVLAVTLITIANGGDNIAVYVPIFARHQEFNLSLLLLIYFLMTGVWCLLARYLTAHKKIDRFLRHQTRLFPFILIAVGSYLLFR